MGGEKSRESIYPSADKVPGRFFKLRVTHFKTEFVDLSLFRFIKQVRFIKQFTVGL